MFVFVRFELKNRQHVGEQLGSQLGEQPEEHWEPGQLMSCDIGNWDETAGAGGLVVGAWTGN